MGVFPELSEKQNQPVVFVLFSKDTRVTIDWVF